MRISCRQHTLLPIVLVLKRSARVTENAKNASSITTRKAICPIAEDNRFKNHVFSVLLSIATAEPQMKDPSQFATVMTSPNCFSAKPTFFVYLNFFVWVYVCVVEERNAVPFSFTLFCFARTRRSNKQSDWELWKKRKTDTSWNNWKWQNFRDG